MTFTHMSSLLACCALQWGGGSWNVVLHIMYRGVGHNVPLAHILCLVSKWGGGGCHLVHSIPTCTQSMSAIKEQKLLRCYFMSAMVHLVQQFSTLYFVHAYYCKTHANMLVSYIFQFPWQL